MERLTKEGYRLLQANKYPEAMSVYKRAASLMGDSPSRQDLIYYVKSLNNIGYIYLTLNRDPEQAYSYLIRAKKIAAEYGFNDLMGGILDNIAQIQNDFGDGHGALDTYGEALKYSVADSTDVSGVIQLMIFNGLISCAMENDLIEKVASSLDIFESLPDHNIPMGRYSRAVCYAMRQMLAGNLPESTATLLSATSMIDSKVDKARYQVDHCLMLATLYHLREMPDSALNYLEAAASIASDSKIEDKMPRIDRGFATVLKSKGLDREANEWLLKAYETDDSMHNSTTYARISNIEPTLDIDLLQKEMHIAEVKHHSRLASIWLLSAGIALVCILLVLLILRNRKLKGSYGELATRHKESIRQSEAAARSHHEYMETIQRLQNEIALLGRLPASDSHKTQLPLTEEQRLRIIETVNDTLEHSSEITDPDFSLERLAELAGTKARYLSAVLNESMGKSFTQLLAETRVKRACQMLLSPDFKKTMTVESIASDVGYKSRTQFAVIFKRVTGLTPTQYVTASK